MFRVVVDVVRCQVGPSKPLKHTIEYDPFG